MRKRSVIVSGLLLLMLSLTVSATMAQEFCENLVRDVWENVKDNCDNTDTLTACYGFDSLTPTFNQTVDNGTFTQPSDKVQLPELHTVHTQPFDAEIGEWGVSDFRIDASAFGGKADEAVVIFITGDTVVENAVEPGSDLQPMQAFNFTTAGKSPCRNAPNAVFIQAPKGLKVDLTVNSTPIQIHSTVVLGTDTADDGKDLMYFSVIEGALILNPGTAQEKTVNKGEYTTTELSNNTGAKDSQHVPVLDPVTGKPVVGPGGKPFFQEIPVSDFTEPEAMSLTGDDFTSWDAYNFVTQIPKTLVDYTVSVPQPQPVVTNNTNNTTVVRPTAVPTEVVSDEPAVGDPTQNWCYPGGPWGDGRCNNPDPGITAWLWNAGWYHAALERGAIDALPDEYAPPVPQVVVSGPPVSTTFTATMTQCTVNTPGVDHFIHIVFTNMPAGMDHVRLVQATTSFVTITGSPNPVNGTVPDGNLPIVTVEAYDVSNNLLGSASLGGIPCP